MKFDAFGTSKHREGKSLSKNFFAILISTLGRFNRENKKIMSIIHFKPFTIACVFHSTRVGHVGRIVPFNLRKTRPWSAGHFATLEVSACQMPHYVPVRGGAGVYIDWCIIKLFEIVLIN